MTDVDRECCLLLPLRGQAGADFGKEPAPKRLADHVIPPVPVRQWVISVPKRLRGMLADRPKAVAALTKIFVDQIERLLCVAAGGTSDAPHPPARGSAASPFCTASGRRSTTTCTCTPA